MLWRSRHNIRFDPIYSRQAFQKDGRFVFWGGLVLEAEGENFRNYTYAGLRVDSDAAQ